MPIYILFRIVFYIINRMKKHLSKGPNLNLAPYSLLFLATPLNIAIKSTLYLLVYEMKIFGKMYNIMK